MLRFFLLAILSAAALAGEPPLMRDFIGLNVHTVKFQPALYAPVTRVVRDYHPLRWDVGEDTSAPLEFPFAKNRVQWAQLYGGWKKAGYRAHASIMFDDLKPAAWKDVERDARAYGRAFAQHFGPSGKDPVLEAAEIGNEPGAYDDATYRRLFSAMAAGLREGDPKLRIVTCAATLGASHKYAKSVGCFADQGALWDVLNVHLYAEVEGWPTWRRSFPEDPAAKWLSQLTDFVKWRDAHAPGKEIWLTEFGYDASTKPAPTSGTFSKWQGSTEEQQAMWDVRSYLLAARHGVERAHCFFFNDSDEPHVHGSSGLTRDFQPKPAFHAIAWLLRSLGDYRFFRVDREDSAECFAYEFTHGTDANKRVLAVWKPDGEPRTVRIFHDPLRIIRAERMPLTSAPAEAVKVRAEIEGYLAVEAAPQLMLVWLEK